MTYATESPLQPGRYWIDLIGEERIAKFGGGIKGLNDAHPGIIKIISATRHLANEARDYAESDDLTGVLVGIWEALAGRISETPERDWVLFQVTSPAVWDFETMGTPTIAGPNVKSEADTVQRPDPEKDPLDKLREELAAAASTGKAIISGALTIGIGAGLVWLASKFMRRKRA